MAILRGGSRGHRSNYSGGGSAGVGVAAGTVNLNGIPRNYSGSTLDEKGVPFANNPNTTIVPLEVDQRLDPGAVYMRWDHSDSRRSLQDEHDYSRKILRVTNPDFGRGSMESGAK